MDVQPSFFSSSIFKRELTFTISFLLLLLTSLLFLNIIGPFQPQSLLRNGFLSEIPDTRVLGLDACDYSNGTWVLDENYWVRSYTEDCSFLDPGFRCHRNGRTDDTYIKWRWQPNGCDIPRFNATEMLERSRNRRIVFAGDSIGRNQWESLVCMLAQAVSNQSNIYEENGNPISKHKGYLSMRFTDYNFTIEYYRAPFLVIIDRPPNNSLGIQSAIRVDKLHWRSKQWVSADVLVFNAGHWWNQEKTLKMGCYFQEGETVNKTMDVMEAFRRSLQTWKQWVVRSLDLEKSHVFFRSYSPVHFRGGTWNDGGECNNNTVPETNHTELELEPWNNLFISETIKQINGANRKVQFLNITYLTEFRKDGHPSIHREPGTPTPFRQDCSHWCLPGVPDTWNELLYAFLLSRDYSTGKNKKKVKLD